MPTVPRSTGRTVAPIADRTPYQTAAGAELIGGPAINAGMRLAGRNLEIFAQENDENEARLAKDEFDAQVRNILHGTADAPGYLAQNGMNAIRSEKDTYEAIDKARSDLQARLANTRQRNVFNALTANKHNSAFTSVSVHSVSQRPEANKMISQNARASHLADAVEVWDQEDARNTARTKMIAESLRYGSRELGLEGEALYDYAQQDEDAYHRAIVDRYLAEGDLVGAQEYFREEREHMTGLVETSIQEDLNKSSNASLVSLRDSVRDSITVLETGQADPASDALASALQSPAFAGNESAEVLLKDLREAQDAQVQISEFNSQSVPDQTAELRRLRRKQNKTAKDLRLLDKLEKNYTALAKSVHDGDALAAASDRNLLAEPIEPVTDYTDVGQLRKRRDQAGEATAALGVPVSPLLDTETDVLINSLVASPNPQTSVQILDSVHAGLGEDYAYGVANQLADKKAADLGIALTLTQRDPTTAMRIAQGGKLVRANPDLKVTQDERDQAANEVLGNVFTAATAEGRASILAAADALYAYNLLEGEQSREGGTAAQPTSPVSAYKDALNQVVGGQMLEHGGRKIFPPQAGMTQSQFDDMLANLTQDQLAGLEVDGQPVTLDMLDDPFLSDPQVFLVSRGLNGMYSLKTIDGRDIMDGDRAAVLDLSGRASDTMSGLDTPAARPQIPQSRLASDLVMFHESEGGPELHVYKDSVGISTIGVGFNLERADAREKIEDLGVDYDDLVAGKVDLTEDQAIALFEQDMETAYADAADLIGVYDQLDPVRQAALTDMSFNLGKNRLGKFSKMIDAINRMDWETAAAEAQRSRWYKQVGRRGPRIVHMLATGLLPGSEVS